jgi:formamidopyrimidine-DNA glycosylase
MPELPDVELYKRYLDQHALRQPIERVAVNDARIVGGLPAQAFIGRLTGNRFEATRRHGKHLLVRLRRDGTMLRVDIEDDGRVTFPLREGHGLTGMRERIDALGGSLRIERAGRGGVRIEAAFPA